MVSEQEVGTSDASGVTEDINEYIVPTPVPQAKEVDGINVMEFEPLNLGDQEQIRLQEKKTAARHIPNPSLVKANRIKKEQETAMMLERASGVEPLDDNSIISETRAALPGSDVNKAKAEKKALEAEKKALEESEALGLAEYLILEMGLKISPSELVKDKERMKVLSITHKKTNKDPYAGLREATKQMRVIEPKSKEAAEALGREWNPDAAKERDAKIKDKERIIELRDAYATELLKELGGEIKETDYLKELLEVDGDEELAKKNLKDGLNEIGNLFLTDTERSIKKLQTEIDKLEAYKNDGGTWNEKQSNAYIEKVRSIQAFRYDEKELGTSQLYDPVTGEFMQNERADKATVDFNEILDEELLKYEDSGRGDLEKRRDELYYALKTEVMEILLRQQPKDRNPLDVRRDGDGNVIPMTKKEILTQSENHSKAFPFSYGALITGGSRNSGDFSNWINVLNSPYLYTDEQKADANELYARFIGINRALNLNEDPGTLREGGFIEGVVEVFDKALDGTKGEKFDKTEVFMTEMKSMGIPLTEQQEREMGQSFSKTLGSTVAESTLVMADIAVGTYLLGGVGSALRIPARIRKLSRTLGGGNKVMQFGYNVALQSAAYEMAGQSAFSGAGEYAAESSAGRVLEKLGSKNAMLNFVLKLAAGTTGETIAEYAGGFAENLYEGGDIKKAAEDTFGKTKGEAAEIFGLTFITSLMFSSVGLTSREIANSKRNARDMLVESGSQSPIVTDIIETLTKELEAAEEQKTSLTQKKDEAVSAVQNALAEAKKSGGEAMVDGKVVTEATIKEIEDAYESKVSELEIVDVNEYRRTSKDEKNPEVKKLKEQIEGLRDENGLIPQDKKTELDRLNKAIAEVEAQTTSDVEAKEAADGDVIPRVILITSSNIKTNLDNGRKKQVVTAEGVIEEDFDIEDVELEFDVLSTLAERGKLTWDKIASTYIGQSISTSENTGIKELIESDPVGFVSKLKESFSKKPDTPTTEVEAKEAEIEEKSNLEITEVEEYVDELDKTKKSDPKVYWSVSEVSEVDAKEGTVVNTEDGSALVKKDGDIVGVFKKITSKAKGVAQDLLKRAVKAGGTKLDNFDGYLTKQYEKAGFRVVSRTPFNEEYAPEGWDKDAHGTPDVVAMVYDPKGELDIEEKSFNDYDEAISYRDSMVPETKVEQNKTVSGQTLSDPKSTTQKRGESLAAEFKEIEASKKDTSKIEEQVENAKKAIAKVSPKTTIVVHKTAKDYKNSGKNRKQNEGGEYDIEKDTIHINLESANERTVAHELFHALLLNKGMNDKQAKSVTDNMLKAVKKTASPELLARLEEFSGRYESALQSEESIAELFGILAAGYPTLPKPTQNIIKRWLDKLAKLFGLKMFTDNEVVDMLNVVSKKIKEGVEISEKELKPIRKKVDLEKEFEGGIPVDELTDEDLDQDQTSQWKSSDISNIITEQGDGGAVGEFNLRDRKHRQ